MATGDSGCEALRHADWRNGKAASFPRYRNDKNCTTGPESGDLAYSGEAAKKGP